MGLKINKKLLDIFKKVKTTSDEYTYPCSYINNLVEEVYSTNEIKTNKVWIDGKSIYIKVIHINSLPNAQTTTYDTGLDHRTLDFKKIEGICYDSSIVFPIPNARTLSLASQIGIWLNKEQTGKISIETGSDRSGMSGDIILEYTKTTD